MKIGLITYDAPHLKTEQIACALSQRGRYDLAFFALPFVPRPARTLVFAHRPEMADGAHSREVAAASGAAYLPVPTADAIPPDAADLFLITGAGLLPSGFVMATRGRVINSHPGMIPLVRGLDAFKWAILDGMPIGNSLHFIDEQADAGEVLAVSETPLYPGDTLEQFARRHYECELWMMLDFERAMSGPRPDRSSIEARPARMRMPAAQQEMLWDAFDAYKARRFSASNARSA